MACDQATVLLQANVSKSDANRRTPGSTNPTKLATLPWSFPLGTTTAKSARWRNNSPHTFWPKPVVPTTFARRQLPPGCGVETTNTYQGLLASCMPREWGVGSSSLGECGAWVAFDQCMANGSSACVGSITHCRAQYCKGSSFPVGGASSPRLRSTAHGYPTVGCPVRWLGRGR